MGAGLLGRAAASAAWSLRGPGRTEPRLAGPPIDPVLVGSSAETARLAKAPLLMSVFGVGEASVIALTTL
jgi:hypothetical protein